MRPLELQVSNAETVAGPSALQSATGSRWVTFQREFPTASIALSIASTAVVSTVVRLVMVAQPVFSMSRTSGHKEFQATTILSSTLRPSAAESET